MAVASSGSAPPITTTVLTDLRRRPPIGKMRRWYLAGDSNATRRLGLRQSKVRRVFLEAGVTMRSRVSTTPPLAR
jgi:hypothetical protein